MTSSSTRMRAVRPNAAAAARAAVAVPAREFVADRLDPCFVRDASGRRVVEEAAS